MELPAQLCALMTLILLACGPLPDLLRRTPPRRPRVHGVLPRPAWPG